MLLTLFFTVSVTSGYVVCEQTVNGYIFFMTKHSVMERDWRSIIEYVTTLLAPVKRLSFSSTDDQYATGCYFE